MNNDLYKIIDEVSNAPLRSSVITAAAVIDTVLEKLIERFLIEDSRKLDIFSFSGCLGTFSAKMKMAYAMGLISEELFKDINIYRDIRNKCAHNMVIDESIQQSILDKVKNFKLLHSTFEIQEHEDPINYTALEFAIILVALTKRMNNIEQRSKFLFEAHDSYLAFDKNDTDLLQHFNEHFKQK